MYLPDSMAAHSHCRSISLQLWQQDTLLDCSAMLLLPASHSDVASELESLPWGSEGCEDVADCVRDLGQWLHQCESASARRPTLGSNSGSSSKRSSRSSISVSCSSDCVVDVPASQADPDLWAVGTALLQQVGEARRHWCFWCVCVCVNVCVRVWMCDVCVWVRLDTVGRQCFFILHTAPASQYNSSLLFCRQSFGAYLPSLP